MTLDQAKEIICSMLTTAEGDSDAVFRALLCSQRESVNSTHYSEDDAAAYDMYRIALTDISGKNYR